MIVENAILGLSIILLLGIFAQWLAWQLGVPSILFLLSIGFLAGPVFNLISPDQILGDLLFSLVSLSVAILVFEGALNLRFADLRKTGIAVRNLLSIGMMLTWSLAAFSAYLFLEISVGYALLIGAILTVTGPTVITPLLRSMRISPRLSTILRWEGIIIDPIGAILAVLVYETFFRNQQIDGGIDLLFFLFKTISLGIILGLFSAYILLFFFRKGWVPEFLQSPVTLATLITMFSLSNIIQHETGLLTVTVMGLAMANQKNVAINKITEFKETLQVLLIAILFIVLSSRIEIESLKEISIYSFFFIFSLLFIIRPISVYFSAIGTKLRWREILFLSMIAPRGIVAAAISSLLALELQQLNYPKSDLLVGIIFSVICVSGIVSTIGAKPLAKVLGLLQKEALGILFLGAHQWARKIASILQDHNIPVLLVDTNSYNIYRARTEGLRVSYANILEERTISKVDFNQVGRFLALTSNDEVNSLASLSFQKIVGEKNVFQLSTAQNKEIRSQQLFQKDLVFSRITNLYNNAWEIKAFYLESEKEIAELKKKQFYPLLQIKGEKVEIFSIEEKINIREASTLIVLTLES